jgi:hypothetical protein
VVDILTGIHRAPVLEVLSGNKAWPMRVNGKPSFFRFNNRRTQMWWLVREMFRTGMLRITVPDGPLRRKLIKDLVSVRYRVRSDRVMEVESKDDVKERLQRSTDFGDAFVYGLSEAQPRMKRAAIPPTVSQYTHTR